MNYSGGSSDFSRKFSSSAAGNIDTYTPEESEWAARVEKKSAYVNAAAISTIALDTSRRAPKKVR